VHETDSRASASFRVHPRPVVAVSVTVTESRRAAAHAPRLLVGAAFATLYVVWGSTYLAIRYAVESFPPLLMSGTRFLCAGGVLLAWALARGARRPGAAEWRRAALVGALLVAASYGLLGWAEQYIASSLAALIVASLPVWIVLLDMIVARAARPPTAVMVGIALGLAGQVLLLWPELRRGVAGSAVAVLAVFASNGTWAVGTLAVRRTSRDAGERAPLVLTTAMQMLAGGAMLVVAGLALGEAAPLLARGITPRSALAWAYLVGPGSMLTFTAYAWLLTVTSPARVATYAYVNPVVAVFLGWLLAGEPVTGVTVGATAVILGSVVLINAASDAGG
jgi:drug/metabolite transporter (DMT)-like permease